MGFFQEDNGNYSSMRLMSVMALLAAIGLAFYGSNDVIIGLFLTYAFAPKVIQKAFEK